MDDCGLPFDAPPDLLCATIFVDMIARQIERDPDTRQRLDDEGCGPFFAAVCYWPGDRPAWA